MAKECRFIVCLLAAILAVLALIGLVANIPALKFMGACLLLLAAMMLFIHCLAYHFRPRKERGDG